MSTIRVTHKKKFTSISNALAQNNNLSLRSRGLMLYLLSLPDDWVIHVNHLTKSMKEGRDAILASLKELKSFGYIHHVKNGFKEGWEYHITEESTNEEEFKLFLRTNAFPNNWETQQLANPHLQNTKEEDIQKTNLPTKQTHGGKSNLIEIKERVKLTKKQCNELIKTYGKEAYEWMIEKLNTYKVTKNQTYNSDFKAMKNWVIGAWKNDVNKDAANKVILEKNLKIIKEIQENMERKQKRGILTIDGDQARDTVLGKSCSLFNLNMPEIVAKWYGWTWKD